MILLGGIVSFAFSLNSIVKTPQLTKIVNFLGNLWFLPYNSRQPLSFFLLKVARAILKYNDQA
jgi:hypothetical protein